MAQVVIRPGSGWSPGVDELWGSRGLLYFLVWRNVKVRYKQTVLGFAWAVMQPVLTMVVFSLFFGKLAKVPSDDLPYPIFSYAALVPWTFFSNGVSQASTSLVGSANLLRKVYFPRLLIPLSSILAGLVDFVIAFVVLLLMMLHYDVVPGLSVLAIPLLVALAFVTALGTGLFLSALNVRYRDVRFALTFLMQIWLFATPVAYPSSLLAEPWRTLYGINPMVGVIEGFRWALLGADTAPGAGIAVSSATAVAILGVGWAYFRRTERAFADHV